MSRTCGRTSWAPVNFWKQGLEAPSSPTSEAGQELRAPDAEAWARGDGRAERPSVDLPHLPPDRPPSQTLYVPVPGLSAACWQDISGLRWQRRGEPWPGAGDEGKPWPSGHAAPCRIDHAVWRRRASTGEVGCVVPSCCWDSGMLSEQRWAAPTLFSGGSLFDDSGVGGKEPEDPRGSGLTWSGAFLCMRRLFEWWCRKPWPLKRGGVSGRRREGTLFPHPCTGVGGGRLAFMPPVHGLAEAPRGPEARAARRCGSWRYPVLRRAREQYLLGQTRAPAASLSESGLIVGAFLCHTIVYRNPAISLHRLLIS